MHTTCVSKCKIFMMYTYNCLYTQISMHENIRQFSLFPQMQAVNIAHVGVPCQHTAPGESCHFLSKQKYQFLPIVGSRVVITGLCWNPVSVLWKSVSKPVTVYEVTINCYQLFVDQLLVFKNQFLVNRLTFYNPNWILVSTQSLTRHKTTIQTPSKSTNWTLCNVLFISIHTLHNTLDFGANENSKLHQACQLTVWCFLQYYKQITQQISTTQPSEYWLTNRNAS